LFFEDLLLKKGNFNSMGSALFCIFVRNGISLPVGVEIIIVGISSITGFLMLLKPAMFSMYLYPGDIWFSDKISQGGNHEIVNSLTHLFK